MTTTARTSAPRGPREWRLSADDPSFERPRSARVLPVVALALFVTACAVPLGASFYLLAWPALNEPNSAIPGMLGSLAVLAAAVGGIALVLRLAGVVRDR